MEYTPAEIERIRKSAEAVQDSYDKLVKLDPLDLHDLLIENEILRDNFVSSDVFNQFRFLSYGFE